MNITEPFTIDYFRKEICEFRKLFGDLNFWQKPLAIRQKAVDALAYVYLNLEMKDIDNAAMLLQATIAEYLKREFLMVEMGKCTMD